jgi:hypothetical protein
MNRIVWAVALILCATESGSGALSPGLVQGSGEKTAVSPLGEKDAPVRTLACHWASDSEIDKTKLAEENAVRLALYEVVVSGRGVVKARKDCATVEGDPLPVHAKAEGRKLKITYDYSRDRHLPLKGLLKLFRGNSYTTRKVEIGYLDQGKFIPLNGTASGGRRLLLRLKWKEYF